MLPNKMENKKHIHPTYFRTQTETKQIEADDS